MPATKEHSMDQLLNLMRRLRDPEHGCPWDKAQTFESISKHTLEETYELVEAIQSGDIPHIKEELGDLLLQIAYYAQIGSEKKQFNFDDIAQGIIEKILRRYRHVFGSEKALTAEEVTVLWEKVKAEERKNKPAPKEGPVSYSFGPKSAPALTRAAAVAKKAVKDQLTSTVDVIALQIKEEVDEVLSAQSLEHREEELGDLLLASAWLCQKCEIDPEHALQKATQKFISRWQGIYEMAKADGQSLSTCSASTLDSYWKAVKKLQSGK